MQATDYYPFGKSFDNVDVGSKNRYLYNGKELQDQVIGSTFFGWYDYGARFYDPEIGRWHSVDPLEQYESGYVYAGNNPISHNDPTGMWAERAFQDISSTFVDKNNKVIWHVDDGDNKVYRVDDVNSWIKGGRKKGGLDVVGEEDPQRNYTVGSHYDFYISPNTLFLIKTFSTINKSLDWWSDFFGGPSGEDVPVIDKLQYATIMAVISKVKLPTKGKVQYKPPKGWKNPKKLPSSPKGGFIDELGNIWNRPKGATIQGELHWDVTLSNKGKVRYNTTKNHLNVNQNGEIAH